MFTKTPFLTHIPCQRASPLKPDPVPPAPTAADQEAAAVSRQKEDKQRLTRPVAFRLTEADHAAYLEKVEASGMKPSEFFRECVLTNRTQVVARQKSSADKQRLIYLFNKTSNNVNQLAHRANLDYNAGTISEATYSNILDQLELMTRYMKAVINDVD
jgi:hypothetical protein